MGCGPGKMFPSSVEEHLTSPGQPPHLGQELLHLGHLSLWTKANILGSLIAKKIGDHLQVVTGNRICTLDREPSKVMVP